MLLSEKLNLDISWNKHKHDLEHVIFVDHPVESFIIDKNFDGWAGNLKSKLDDYNPSPSKVIDIPKKGFNLRPGSFLTSEDATIYQALLLCEIDKIRNHLQWSASKFRYSNILKEDQSGKKWFVNEIEGWLNFRKKSIEIINNGNNWVVFSDISAYFENISIQLLISNLNEISLSSEVVECLSNCLNKWAHPRQRGIPQGYTFSSILSEIYFNNIDQGLFNSGIKFCRYVDDVHMFCSSKEDAIEALHVLTKLVRDKELNLQSAKTFIREGTEAIDNINGATSLVNETAHNLKDELREVLKFSLAYATPSDIENYIEQHDITLKLESIIDAFNQHIKDDIETFDKTLFHYCINRLGAADDDLAVEFCLKTIKDRPEEFQYILGYFSKLKDKKIQIAESIVGIIETSKLDRHILLFLRWLYEYKLCSEQILKFCREIIDSTNKDDYIAHYAWVILGENGNSADLDKIRLEYNAVNSDISKATIVCAIKRMTKDKRNSTYARIKNDSIFVGYALKTVN